MALRKKRNPRLDQLVAAAAAEIKERIPSSLGAQEQPLSEVEHQELEQIRQELERVWDAMDQTDASSVDEAGARAVDEDRGRQGSSLEYWYSVSTEISSQD